MRNWFPATKLRPSNFTETYNYTKKQRITLSNRINKIHKKALGIVVENVKIKQIFLLLIC